jgi:hypothetical protein
LSMTMRLDDTRQPCTHVHITGFVGFAQGSCALPSRLKTLASCPC